MDRRNFIKAASATGAAAAAGGIGVASMGTAAAHSELSFSADTASVTNHDGNVASVSISPTGQYQWEGFDESIRFVDVEFEARILTGDGSSVISGWETVFDNKFELSESDRSHDSAFSLGNCGQVTLYQGSDADPFDETEDGKTRERQVEIRITVTLRNSASNVADPNDVAQSSDTATLKVTTTNEAAHVSGSGTANGSASGA